MTDLSPDADFHFGTGGSCCGKPVGCNLPLEGCKYPQHPWKRAQRGEDVRCQAVGWVNGRGGPENRNQCVLRNGHTGRHVGEKGASSLSVLHAVAGILRRDHATPVVTSSPANSGSLTPTEARERLAKHWTRQALTEITLDALAVLVTWPALLAAGERAGKVEWEDREVATIGAAPRRWWRPVHRSVGVEEAQK